MRARPHRCDGCGQPIDPSEYFSDDSVCGGTDGPGFFLCGGAECQAAIDALPGRDARAEYYGARRAHNLIVEHGERQADKLAARIAIVREHIADYPVVRASLERQGLTLEIVLAVLDTLRGARDDLAGQIDNALEDRG